MFRGICIEPMCIIVDYCDGGSLYDFLKKQENKIDDKLKLKFIKDIIRGMIHLHTRLEQELIHRDLYVFFLFIFFFLFFCYPIFIYF